MIPQVFVRFPKRGHCSATYFSAASRITHAKETFFCLAMISSEAWISDGKVTDVLVEGSNLVLCAITVPISYLHHVTSL